MCHVKFDSYKKVSDRIYATPRCVAENYSRVKIMRNHTVEQDRRVKYSILTMCLSDTVSEISNVDFSIKIWVTPLHVIQGNWKMALFDKAYATSYQYAIVSTGVSCTITIIDVVSPWTQVYSVQHFFLWQWHVALFNYVQCPRNYCDGVTLNQCLINNNFRDIWRWRISWS